MTTKREEVPWEIAQSVSRTDAYDQLYAASKQVVDEEEYRFDHQHRVHQRERARPLLVHHHPEKVGCELQTHERLVWHG